MRQRDHGGAKYVQRVMLFGGVRGPDLDATAVAGMREVQRPRMEPLTFQAKLFREHRIGSVGEVAGAGVVQRGEVHPNLMCASGFQLDVEQAGSLVGLQRVVVRDALPAALGDGELPVVPAVPADGRVDGAA